MFRSPRLEAIFGKRLDQVTYQDIKDLIGNPAAAEAADLDYKRLVDARDEKGKTEFTKDVLAMGNGPGGIIFIGVDEDARAVPQSVPGVDISDSEQRRFISLVASRAMPHLPFRVRPLAEPGKNSHGVLMVVIERSLLAPHALLGENAKEGWLRYPIRDGALTRWMQEPEVAARYRDRFTEARKLDDRLDEVEEQAVYAYEDRDEQQAPSTREGSDWLVPRFAQNGVWRARPILVVSLVPELAGQLRINRQSLMDFRASLDESPLLLPGAPSFERVLVAPGRFIAVLGNQVIAMYAELHADGSGAFIIPLVWPEKGNVVAVDVPDVMYRLLSGLRYLGRHARDRAGASGVAAIRFSLLGGVTEVGAPGPAMTSREEPYSMELVVERNYGAYAGTEPTTRAAGEASVLVDDLADDGPGLVAAAATLANEAFHAFGLAEVTLMNEDGSLVPEEWGRTWAAISQWAQDAGLV